MANKLQFPEYEQRLVLLQQRYSPAFFAALKGMQWPAAWRAASGNAGGTWQQREDGQSMAFKHHRPYTEGDDARQIDWALYARTRKLYSRVHYEERMPELLLLLDNSQSMLSPDWQHDFLRVIDHVVALAWLALQAGFQVRCVPVARVGDAITGYEEGFLWRTSRALSQQGIAQLAMLAPQGQLSASAVEQQAHRWRRHDCFVMLVSDCQLEAQGQEEHVAIPDGLVTNTSLKTAKRLQHSVNALEQLLEHFMLPQYRVCLAVVSQPLPGVETQQPSTSSSTPTSWWQRWRQRQQQRVLLRDAESKQQLLVRASARFVAQAEKNRQCHHAMLRHMAEQQGIQYMVWAHDNDLASSLQQVLQQATPSPLTQGAWSATS